ncbi:MAG: MBL fold metallo-hydrolase [Phycisphaerales bacterium JB037]
MARPSPESAGSPPRPNRMAMARSGLRRYPRALVRSLLGRPCTAAEAGTLELDDSAPDLSLAAAWLGHASILLRLAGCWIAVDPVLGDRIGLRLIGRTVGVERLIKPALTIERLPTLDLLLLTHAHFDHLDRPTLKRLADPRTRVITATRTRRLIPKGFGSVEELGWDHTLDHPRSAHAGGPPTTPALTVAAIQPNHWGARRALDRRRGYNSYVLDSGDRRVLVTGDTAFTRAFEGLAETDKLDLAVFGIGAYEPWQHQHATPEEVWDMFLQSGANYLMPVHHSTFPLSDEHPDEPMRRLLEIAGDDADRIVGRDLGELWTPPE